VPLVPPSRSRGGVEFLWPVARFPAEPAPDFHEWRRQIAWAGLAGVSALRLAFHPVSAWPRSAIRIG
jgi:hypothetical protein